MPRPCSICRHPQRPGLDSAIAGGQTPSQAAAALGLSRSAVVRHARNGHVVAGPVSALDETASDLPERTVEGLSAILWDEVCRLAPLGRPHDLCRAADSLVKVALNAGDLRKSGVFGDHETDPVRAESVRALRALAIAFEKFDNPPEAEMPTQHTEH